MTLLIAIPARWGSSRFPGKPLAMIAGKPLLERVVDLARRATAMRDDVVIAVATDDERIARLAETVGARVAMTASDLSCGTSRAFCAARVLLPGAPAVLNLQGDAPFVPVWAIAAVIDALAEGAKVATPVVALSWNALDALRDQKRTTPFSGTTCVRAADGQALWFSKQIIPAIRDEAAERRRGALSPVFRHLGVYGYTMDALQRFERMPSTSLERLEGLEQLRFFATGDPIRTVLVEPGPLPFGGIDTPEDIVIAEGLIATNGDPFRG